MPDDEPEYQRGQDPRHFQSGQALSGDGSMFLAAAVPFDNQVAVFPIPAPSG